MPHDPRRAAPAPRGLDPSTPGATRPDAGGWRRFRPPAGALPWLAVLAFGVVQAVRHAWVSDDIYITFRYCDQLLAGNGPVYNPGEHTEGYTHFLWFLLLTLGRRLGFEAETLGTWAGLPFFAGILVLLVHLSGRWFPGRGGWHGLPLAALLWALHEDAQLFASSGLETSCFLFLLLLGLSFLTDAVQADVRDRRREALAAWAFAMATLTRPEGMLFSGLAAAWLAVAGGGLDVRRAVRWLAFWALLVGPLFVFRLAYYHEWLPNPYYAKSGGGANWIQGWVYLRTYFGAYPVLAAGVLAVVPVAWDLLRRARRRAGIGPTPALLAFTWVAAVLDVLYVTRVGGDFMFARFYLPASVFGVLLVESLVQRIPRAFPRLVLGIAAVAWLVLGVGYKHRLFANKQHVWGIVDESQYYPPGRLEIVRANAEALRRCFAGTDAVFMVQGGQASLAYYARFPVAIERYGLTDSTIAHGPTPTVRGRPGHEKLAEAAYIYRRGVQFRIHHSLIRSLPQFVLLGIPSATGMVYGEIIQYKRAFMDRLKGCPGIRFLDFPLWLEHDYLPRVATIPPPRLQRDYDHFLRYYFDHNADPEHLKDRLEAAMRQRGIEPRRLPLRPDEFEDTARPALLPPGALQDYRLRRRH